VSNDSLKHQLQVHVLEEVCHGGQTKPHTTYAFIGMFFLMKAVACEIQRMDCCRYLHIRCMDHNAEDKLVIFRRFIVVLWQWLLFNVDLRLL